MDNSNVQTHLKKESVSGSVVSDSATPWPITRQASLSMGILQARVLEWVGFHSPGNLSKPGMEPGSPVLQVDMYPNYILSLLLNNAKCLEISQKFTLKQCKVLEISQKFTYNFTVSFLHPWLNLPQTRYYCNIYH